MASHDFFAVQMKLLKYCGIRTKYPAGCRGILMKASFYALALSNIFWTVAEANYLILNISDLKNNAETMANFISTFYSCFQFFVFSYKMEDLKVILSNLNTLTDKGSGVWFYVCYRSSMKPLEFFPFFFLIFSSIKIFCYHTDIQKDYFIVNKNSLRFCGYSWNIDDY